MHPALVILAIWLLFGPVVVAAWTLAAALRMLATSLYGQLTAFVVRRQQRAALMSKLTYAARTPVALPTSQHTVQLSGAA
jgi:hypothetical protein